MKKLLLLLFVFIGLNTSAFGFATIMTTVNGGDAISFTTDVNDTTIYLNKNKIGKFSGMFVYKVQRDGKPKVFTFEKAGYKTQTVELETSLDPLFWGNFLIGGSTGSSIDSWFTKNSQQYSPNQFYISMKKG